MSTTYKPDNVPGSYDQAWFTRELAKIYAALGGVKRSETFEYRHVAPEKSNKGDLVLADGSDWNPGFGPGLYLRDEANTAWEFVAGNMQSGTAQATTSGTVIDFTGIPAWVRRISINFGGVSTSGTDHWLVQIGDSGGVETSSYAGAGANVVDASSSDVVAFSAGFGFPIASAGAVMHGRVVLELLVSSTNYWTATGSLGTTAGANLFLTTGSKALSSTLTQVRITTTGGTNTLDLGAINILYE